MHFSISGSICSGQMYFRQAVFESQTSLFFPHVKQMKYSTYSSSVFGSSLASVLFWILYDSMLWLGYFLLLEHSEPLRFIATENIPSSLSLDQSLLLLTAGVWNYFWKVSFYRHRGLPRGLLSLTVSMPVISSWGMHRKLNINPKLELLWSIKHQSL